MNRFLRAYLALFVLSSANLCSAAVFERDWKTAGDGLLTYDDVSRREWLDLSVSRLDQYPEPRLENAIAQIGSGGLFEGFAWAKSPDVIGIAKSAGINVATTEFVTNQAPTLRLIELLGATRTSSASIRSVGLLDEINVFTQQQ